MIGDFSIILSTDLFVLSVTRMKIPVVLDFEMTLSPQIVYHKLLCELALFKMDQMSYIGCIASIKLSQFKNMVLVKSSGNISTPSMYVTII